MQNYIVRTLLTFSLTLPSTVALAQIQPAIPEVPASGQSVIGYGTVQEVLDALKAKPGVQLQITKPDAWTIVNEPTDVQWSFTPRNHYAYPAVVRRAIKVKTDGGVYIEMTGLCQAAKVPCDQLMQEFKDLNQRIGQSTRSAVQK